MIKPIIIAQPMERCFPAHDEGSKDRWGVELAPGLVLRNIIIIIRYPTEFNKKVPLP